MSDTPAAKLNDLLNRLQGVVKHGKDFMALCPAHNDRNPSLSVKIDADKILLHCHAGCTIDAVTAALGIRSADLFLTGKNGKAPKQPTVTYLYKNRDGEPVLLKKRWYKPNGKKQFTIKAWVDGAWVICKDQDLDRPKILYNLGPVKFAQAFGSTIYINEGEKACNAFAERGFTATCQPYGAGNGKWLPEYSEELRGCDVVIVADRPPGTVGLAYAYQVAESLEGVAASVRVVQSATTGDKDDAYDHLEAGYTVDQFVPAPPKPKNLLTGADDEEAQSFEWTDLGNARHLISEFGSQMRYCADWGRWLIWDDVKWAEDAPENPKARGLAHKISDIMAADDESAKWGLKCQDSRRISAMLREAQALPNIGVRAEALDTHEMLLCAQNGVIDLRTGELVDQARDQLITRNVGAPYDPDAQCPNFERFLMQISRERREICDLLLRALGYSLTGSTKEHKFFLLYGERGRNGKSTLMEVMQRLLGDRLCSKIRKTLLTKSDDDSARFAKAQLEGRRMVYTSEVSNRSRLDVEFIKEFVGDKVMQLERKNKDAYDFSVQAKLWYSVNALPGADFDSAFKARVVAIPFEQCFYGPDDTEYRDGDLPPDRDLSEKLAAELPGILALLVKGCLRWQEKGELGEPKEVRALKEQYQAENDSIGDWMKDCCSVSDDARIKPADAWKSYSEWTKSAGAMSFFKRRLHFTNKLKERKGIRLVPIRGIDYLMGLELRSDTGMYAEEA